MSPIQLFCFIVLCGVAYAGPYYDANNYIDNVLYGPYRQELPYSYLEPYPLSNIVHEFKELGVKAKANYTEGKLTGFSGVRREGNCGGTRQIGNTVSLNCTLVLDKLSVEYKGTLKYGVVPKVNIKAKGTFSKTAIFVQVTQQIPVYSFAPRVQTLNIVQMGVLKMELTGLGPLNRFLKTLADKLVTVVSPQLYTIVNGRFLEVLNRSVAKMALPQL